MDRAASAECIVFRFVSSRLQNSDMRTGMSTAG